jgi:eukaryotic translation initiation factor 2C
MLFPFLLRCPDPVFYSVFTTSSCSCNFLAFRTAANGSPGNGSPPGSDRKRVKRPYQTKTFKVELSFAAKIPMSAIAMALKGQESEHTQEAIRVIDIILRQHPAKQ